jgi:hypothetical protein
MMAVTPMTVETVSLLGGLQLKLTGTRFDDQISISKSGKNVVVRNKTFTKTLPNRYDSILINAAAGNDLVAISPSLKIDTVLYGSGGNDTLRAGGGSDRLYGQAGVDRCIGGEGDDVIVSIGGEAREAASGGAGADSFWIDPDDRVTDLSSDEAANGALHSVDRFMSLPITQGNQLKSIVVSKELNRQKLPDPVPTSTAFRYRNFSNRPLFSDAGPSAEDVRQGAVGDCYYLAVLSSVAKTNPRLIRESIVDLGDGSYGVQFTSNMEQKSFIRIDGDLPTAGTTGDTPAYAKLGAQGSTWAPLMEKAFAFFRNNAGTYASLSGGWMSEGYNALGKASWSAFSAVAEDKTVLDMIKSELDDGMSVTYAAGNTGNTDAPLVGFHAYSVDSVETDQSGKPVKMKLRNPWGVDGAGADGRNDGYVTITASQAQAALLGITSARV